MEAPNSPMPLLLTDEEYNVELPALRAKGFRVLNRFVMDHTLSVCTYQPDAKKAVEHSIAKQYMLTHEEELDVKPDGGSEITLVNQRTFESTLPYAGKKIAVLNFANNHHVGGSPWSAGAQEESLCRCSTLYPCINAYRDAFYEEHSRRYNRGELDAWGNDDLIYTPDVVVLKTDESAPAMLPMKQWRKLDVITCAAPQFAPYDSIDEQRFMNVMTRRIERIVQVAKKEGVEVLVLGAFGCGAFCSPPELVAKIIRDLAGKYRFDTFLVAIYDHRDTRDSNYHVFAREFGVE